MTPITTDLSGYEIFWTRWLVRLSVGGSVFAVVVLVLLFLIWRKL
jgi:hypothetical protein